MRGTFNSIAPWICSRDFPFTRSATAKNSRPRAAIKWRRCVSNLMNLQPLREMRDAAPCKKFDIRIAAGRSLGVPTPDHLFVMPNSTEFLVVLAEGGFRIVDSPQIVSVGRGPARARGR